MNDVHRIVLTKHTADLVRDIIVSETLLGAMYCRKIFEQEHIEIIRACKTPSDQMYKLLELLPKRGPDAFHGFTEILHEQYEWLARQLNDSLLAEHEKQQQQAAAAAAQTKKEEDNVFTPRATSSLVRLDYDIKSRTSSFVQKQFGQVRRISNTDKKAMERWLGEWLQNERKQLTKALNDANMDLETDVFKNPEVKEKIFSLYLYIIRKLKKQKRKISISPPEKDGTVTTTEHDDDERAILEATERDITVNDADFGLLWSEINELFEDYHNKEKQINRSIDYIGGRGSDRELSLLVHDLCGEYRLLEREMVKERKKIEQMLVELYNYSTDTNKMQNALKTQEAELMEIKEETNKLKQENIDLIKEITILEQARLGHIQKEKTLEELRQTKDDLQTLIEVVNQENKDLKQDLKQMLQGGRATLKYGIKGFQNRRPLGTMNNAGTSRAVITNAGTGVQQRQVQRKPAVPKKRSNSMRY